MEITGDFAEWLRRELEKRGWDQIELARRSGITRQQVSRILNGTRGAGPEACIAIADALRLSREEVFRARGWLKQEAKQAGVPQIDPKAAQIAQEVSELHGNLRKVALNLMQATLDAMKEIDGRE